MPDMCRRRAANPPGGAGLRLVRLRRPVAADRPGRARRRRAGAQTGCAARRRGAGPSASPPPWRGRGTPSPARRSGFAIVASFAPVDAVEALAGLHALDGDRRAEPAETACATASSAAQHRCRRDRQARPASRGDPARPHRLEGDAGIGAQQGQAKRRPPHLSAPRRRAPTRAAAAGGRRRGVQARA